jgi:hypothetical protein
LVYCGIGVALLLGVGGIGYLAFHSSSGGPDRGQDNRDPQPPTAEKPKPQPPDLTKLKLVFDEKFDNPNRWVLTPWKPPTKDTPIGLQGLEGFVDNRRFVIRFSDSELKTVYSASPGFRYANSDYACLLSCRFVGQGEVGWGFVHYFQGERFGVLVSMRPNREVEIAEYVHRSPAAVQRPRFGKFQPPIAESGDGLINLLVILQGQNLTVFVNDRAVSNPIQLERGFGLGVPQPALWRLGEGEARAEFTRYALWQLPETQPETGQ